MGPIWGLKKGNTRSYFQPIFLRQNANFLQVFVYIPVSFFQMSVMHSKPISDEEIGQNIKFKFNFRGHNLLCFLKKGF